MKLDIDNTEYESDYTQYLDSRNTIDSMPNDFRKITRLLSVPSNKIRLKFFMVEQVLVDWLC